MWSRPHRASWRRVTSPWLPATRAKTIPLDPAIRVLSRSKKAAPDPPPPSPSPSPEMSAAAGGSALGAVDFEDDGIALAAATADRGAAQAASAALELTDQGADDPGAGGAD